jgi:putative Holliday junction resolvase
VTRILALDLGAKRIGVALSDPGGVVASPLVTVAHRSAREDAARIAALCREHGVTRIVVGSPRNMDGSGGPAAGRAEAFAGRLRAATALPVELWDERLSTVAAERAMIQAGARREERRDARDRVAAALLLQSYLDAHAPRLAGTGDGYHDA